MSIFLSRFSRVRPCLNIPFSRVIQPRQYFTAQAGEESKEPVDKNAKTEESEAAAEGEGSEVEQLTKKVEELKDHLLRQMAETGMLCETCYRSFLRSD